MFGLTKREQRWKAEQKAAETIACVLVAAINAKSHKGEEMNKSEQLIACLEGEIAKRDVELAACRVAVGNCEVFRARVAELEARIVWLECEAQVNAAPVSDAKAQGVVMPPSPYMPGSQPTDFADYELGEIHGQIAMWEEVKRLNATHVQQASAPDGFVLAKETIVEMPDGSKELGYTTIGRVGIFNSAEEVFDAIRELDLPLGWVSMTTEQLLPGWVLAAAPAAPEADAGLVDMYRHLQTVTPYRFKKIQDASITDGGDVMYFHKDRFDAALLADMAAHCAAKGVV